MSESIAQIIECTDREHRALSHPSISELGLFRRAPLLFKDKYIDGKLYELGEERDDRALKIGTALHLAVLEPKKFERVVRSIPKGLKLNTKLGLDFKTKFIEPGEAQGEIYIKEEDMVHVMGAAQALYAEPQIASLLSRITPETTFLFRPDTVTLCKARLDGFIQDAEAPVVVDLKSTRDVVRFERSLIDYGYHRQAAFYMEAFEQAFGVVPKFYWIAVEVTPPYLYRLMSPTPELLEKGEAEYLETLADFRECVTREYWPGTFKGVEEVTLPHWMKPEEKLTPWKTINTAKEESSNHGINQT
jgi:hypothetical protein